MLTDCLSISLLCCRACCPSCFCCSISQGYSSRLAIGIPVPRPRGLDFSIAQLSTSSSAQGAVSEAGGVFCFVFDNVPPSICRGCG